MSSFANTSGSFALRPARPDDEVFLLELYCTTRRDELGAWGVGGAQVDALLKMQFAARQRHYEIAFPGAEHQIILCDDQQAGRILVYRSDLEIRLVDVALLPEHRGRGAGAWLLENLMAESRATAKPVTLHVDKLSRAAHLYQRLGFVVTADTGADYKMEWREKETAKET